MLRLDMWGLLIRDGTDVDVVHLGERTLSPQPLLSSRGLSPGRTALNRSSGRRVPPTRVCRTRSAGPSSLVAPPSSSYHAGSRGRFPLWYRTGPRSLLATSF